MLFYSRHRRNIASELIHGKGDPRSAAANGAGLGAAGSFSSLFYAWENSTRTKEAARLVEEVRRADGSSSGRPAITALLGLVKNAIDYVEDMNKIRGLISTVARLDVLRLLRDGRLRSRRLKALRSIVHGAARLADTARCCAQLDRQASMTTAISASMKAPKNNWS